MYTDCSTETQRAVTVSGFASYGTPCGYAAEMYISGIHPLSLWYMWKSQYLSKGMLCHMAHIKSDPFQRSIEPGAAPYTCAIVPILHTSGRLVPVAKQLTMPTRIRKSPARPKPHRSQCLQQQESQRCIWMPREAPVQLLPLGRRSEYRVNACCKLTDLPAFFARHQNLQHCCMLRGRQTASARQMYCRHLSEPWQAAGGSGYVSANTTCHH